jgi:hypothetical protein
MISWAAGGPVSSREAGPPAGASIRNVRKGQQARSRSTNFASSVMRSEAGSKQSLMPQGNFRHSFACRDRRLASSRRSASSAPFREQAIGMLFAISSGSVFFSRDVDAQQLWPEAPPGRRSQRLQRKAPRRSPAPANVTKFLPSMDSAITPMLQTPPVAQRRYSYCQGRDSRQEPPTGYNHGCFLLDRLEGAFTSCTVGLAG